MSRWLCDPTMRRSKAEARVATVWAGSPLKTCTATLEEESIGEAAVVLTRSSAEFMAISAQPSKLAIAPVDRFDWLLENLLSLALVVILVFTYRRFRFSLTSYCLIGLFLTFHAVGSQYTYSEVPFGFWLKDVFALSRNPFDRIVHFPYGLLLVYPIRELQVRLAWASFLSLTVILAQSGFFEIAEAMVATLVSPESGSTYLGTQGDEWDAQKDLAATFTGALLTIGVFSALSRSGREGHFW